MKFKPYIVLFLTLIAIPLGVFLVQQITRISPEAQTPPIERFGFLPVDVDINQASQVLRTSSFYTFDYNSVPGKTIHTISKNTSDADPVSLQLLMDNGLRNFGFESGLSDWQPETSGDARVDTDPGIFNRSAVLDANSSGIVRLKQGFSRSIGEGEYAVFGAWVKTGSPDSVDIYLQDSQGQKFTGLEYREYTFPNVNLGAIERDLWTFVRGWGRASQGGWRGCWWMSNNRRCCNESDCDSGLSCSNNVCSVDDGTPAQNICSTACQDIISGRTPQECAGLGRQWQMIEYLGNGNCTGSCDPCPSGQMPAVNGCGCVGAPSTPTPTLNPTPTPSPIIVDFDNNGEIDIYDYAILIEDFGQTAESPADLDNSGVVDIFDYASFVTEFANANQ